MKQRSHDRIEGGVTFPIAREGTMGRSANLVYLDGPLDAPVADGQLWVSTDGGHTWREKEEDFKLDARYTGIEQRDYSEAFTMSEEAE